jgi:serine/threonine protein kinase/Leucine-rich repeat (LRR) protein
MKPTDSGPETKGLKVKLASDALCDRFEQAWQGGDRPDLATFLPADGALRSVALPELVLVDMEYRARAGETASADMYLALYPELHHQADAANRLRAAESRLAHQAQRPSGDGKARLSTVSASPTHLSTARGSNTDPPATTGGEVPDDLTKFLAPPQAEDELGRLGQFRVLKVLGQGGMGVVLLAEDAHLLRPAALKIMLPKFAQDTEAHQRFLREARAAARLKHDHIVTIHQVGESRGAPFLAMEYLEGESLQDRLKREEELPLAEVLRIGREIAEGLQAAHEHGLIHRDIKPGNVWLEGKRGRVKILDFGLARSSTDDVHLTQSGAIVGTPTYMSPEQARGEKVDARCDLYSLGCVLYRLCTGELPLKGNNMTSLLMALATEEPRPVRAINPDVPPALAGLIMRLLAKDPAERPATAGEVSEELAALEREATHPVRDEHTTPFGASAVRELPAPTAPSRSRLGWLVAASLLLLGGTAATIVVIIHDKDGNKVAEIQVPPGGSATIQDNAPAGDAKTKGEIEDAWFQQVADLPPDKQVEAVAAKLKERNPGFDGKVTPTIEGGEVVSLDLLTDDVTDISPVAALRRLQFFSGSGSGSGKGKLADLSPLKGMPLTGLDFHCTRVSDLTPLKGMKLTFLGFAGNKVSDLAPLKGMPLTTLYCDTTAVSDLSPLAGMPLTRLTCFTTQVSDLTPLAGMKLTYLDCAATKVFDLSPLKDMPLTELWCQDTPVTDLSPLAGMPLKILRCDFQPERDAEILRSLKTLEKINDKPAADFWTEVDAAVPKDVRLPPIEDAWLQQVADLPAEKQVEAVAAKLKERNPGFDGKVTHKINNRQVTELRLSGRVRDISALRALPKLSVFDCREAPLSDLSPLAGMKLTEFHCDHTRVSQLSPLKDMKLTYLDCFDSMVSDLSPLVGMPLITLGCARTRVSDLSPLKGMPLKLLSIWGTPVSDLSPLKGMKLTTVYCSDTAVFDLSPLTGMKLEDLRCGGSRVTDLSPLRGMPLKVIQCDFQPERNAEVLRSLKTLETINDKPAADFWMEAKAREANKKP